MAVTLFVISAVMVLWTTAAIVRWMPRERGVRFFVALAAVNLHLTLAHQISSLFHGLNPVGFLVTQAALTALTVVLTPRIARRLGAERGPIPRPLIALVRWPGWVERWGLTAVMLGVVLLVMGYSLTEQMRRPITGWDERMYNCSRVLHWIVHGHIWPWITNNDAQVDFPIGSEVFLCWPLIFIKVEWVARLVFWTGYPCAVGGVYLLGRLMGAGRVMGLAGAAVFAATPTVMHASGMSQKQDVWTAAMFIGTAYWMLRCWRVGDRLSAWMSAMYFVIAVNVKITVVVVAPLLLLCAMAPGGGWVAVRRRVAVMTIAGFGTLAASGLGFTIAHNFRMYGHPFGPKEASKVIAPDWTAQQVYQHAIRTPLFLLELPSHPYEGFRRWFENAGNEWVYRVDAHHRLFQERKGAWPGMFEFEAPPLASKYSIGGPIWMVVLVWGCLAVAKRMVFWKWRALPDAAVIVLISAVQFVALVFLIRWMGGGPDRYWIVPYSIGIAAAAVCVDGWVRKKWWVAVPSLAIVAWMVWASCQVTQSRLNWIRARPISVEQTDEPFQDVVTKLPPGATVFLLGNRDCRDYPLFLPRRGYSVKVWPWGRMPFDEARMERLMEEHRFTHAVFQRSDAVGFHWYRGIRVEPFTKWFKSRPEFREVPLENPEQKMFERVAGQ